MINHDSLYVILFALPIYQILFYTVQLLSFKRKNPSKRYLGLLLLGMTSFLFLVAIRLLGYTETFAWLFLVYLPILLCVAPSFFLYILSITRENHDVNKEQRLILFIPSVIIFVMNLVLLIYYTPGQRVEYFSSGLFARGDDSGLITFPMVVWLLGISFIFFQIIFSVSRLFRIISKESDIMRMQPEHLAYLEWPWVIGISISVLVFLVVNAIFEMIWPAGNLGIVIVFNLLMLLSGGIAGYLGMKQDTLLNQVVNIEKAGAPKYASVNPGEAKPEVQALTGADVFTEDEAKKFLADLNHFLEKDKPYHKPDFSLQDLCDHFGTSRRRMSYLLNEVMGKNFYGVINEFRVREAQELLVNDEVSQLKIEALGEMVGFQSKSSFNACFKKYTGLTPSEYKNKRKAQS